VTVSKDLRTLFEFDLGGRFEAFPDYEDFDRDVDLWMLFEPSQDVFTLRADGYYHHAPGDTTPGNYIWKPLFSSPDPADDPFGAHGRAPSA
jgi:hypothetical protein